MSQNEDEFPFTDELEERAKAKAIQEIIDPKQMKLLSNLFTESQAFNIAMLFAINRKLKSKVLSELLDSYLKLVVSIRARGREDVVRIATSPTTSTTRISRLRNLFKR